MASKLVIVFGSSRTQTPKHLEAAEALGQALAEAGYSVGSGGYSAIMDAISKGAYETGGHVIAYPTDEFCDAVTRWHHEVRFTPNLHTRLEAMLLQGDAFIAMWGGIGTLTEVVLTWNIAQIRERQGDLQKPLILLGDHWPALIRCFDAHTEMGDRVLRYPIVVAEVAEAIAALNQALATDK
ncbi:MAG: LOG family protein [Anaerolineales bacterium]